MTIFQRWELRVRLWLRLGYGPLLVTDYTGKLVRGLVATCSRTAALILNHDGLTLPKPLSLSPLLRVEGGRVEAVYPGSWDGRSTEYPVVESGSTLAFHVGLGPGLEDVIDEVVSCLDKGVNIDFSMHTLRVELVDARRVATYDPGGKPIIRLRDATSVKITLMAPTLPVNPWRPGSRWKRLLPAPSYLLYVNALELAEGDHRRALEMVEAAERTLSPSPATWRTTRLRYYIHSGRLLPALVGYTKLYVEDATPEDTETTEHLLSHAAVMGMGASRAAGFGTTRIETR
ncbi:hypothetical protein Pyrfu_0458 [Pyrolobus fumarii 1A]|uniref:Uncharacterized protein n=1 Tax=Pyrolobus fumarii (strain DSM 11204 / 1A) TaxID=694429 RepID=G0EG81_PYRF1|nr:CRISPR system precrRNA processing endoribonuclease RAMP protein Cas6 [Pyrolobus fumarii]AEM38329.1 hypothetical protein Pyrfu_0458 [Pyrolobus fumarii 1A]